MSGGYRTCCQKREFSAYIDYKSGNHTSIIPALGVLRDYLESKLAPWNVDYIL